mgnify:CR=1 FL=1|tara:strand:- start:185 stop:610 length:426 start_codon:yes stop_codon:yes gene_type:complete
MKRILPIFILVLASCTSLNPLKQDSAESVDYDGLSFIVSNSDENLDEIYQSCLTDAKKATRPLDLASKGVGGTVLLSGAAAIGTGLAGAVSAVPIAVGLVVAGASTMYAGEVYKKYKGTAEVQSCLELSGYKIVILESDDK